MRTVKLIKTECKHIDNSTGQPIDITFEQSAIDQISGANKYSFVELHTCLATFTDKTLKAISCKVEQFAATTNNYDFHTVVIK